MFNAQPVLRSVTLYDSLGAPKLEIGYLNGCFRVCRSADPCVPSGHAEVSLPLLNKHTYVCSVERHHSGPAGNRFLPLLPPMQFQPPLLFARLKIKVKSQ